MSKILEADSVSKEKALKPFWNERSKEIASTFTLPIRTDAVDSDSILLNECSTETKGTSWFSTKLISHPNENPHRSCRQTCMFFPVECTDLEVRVSRLIRLSLTKEQKIIFKNWTDVSRFVFNWTIDYLRSCVNFYPTWMDIKKNMYGPAGLPDWTRQVPFQVKGIAIKEACNAFWKAKGRPTFRSRKNPEQSCFIPKTAIKENGVYPRVSGKGLKFHEALPEKPMDSRLIWRAGKWWISIPKKQTISRSENQASGIVAIDPGIRTFAAFYSPNRSGKIGEGDFSRIYRLLIHLDHLYSDRAKANNRRRKSLTKAIRRLSAKIKNLVDELHWKTARFFCENFSVILLPTFETKEMVKKIKRKIRAKTVRSMLGFGFYKFKQKIKWMAKKLGKTVIDVSEAYTSKTHPQTGIVKNIGSARWIRLIDGSMVDRDLVGAHNILVKFLTENYALGDTPTGLRIQ